MLASYGKGGVKLDRLGVRVVVQMRKVEESLHQQGSPELLAKNHTT